MPIIEVNGSFKMCSWLRGIDDNKYQIGQSFDSNELLNLWHNHIETRKVAHKERSMLKYCNDCCSFTVNDTLNTIYQLINIDNKTDFYLIYNLKNTNNNLNEELL